MKLCRLRRDGAIVPAVRQSETYHDASSVAGDFDPDFFTAGGPAALQSVDIGALPVIDAHDGYAPCIARPSKIVCVGLNYHDHAKESGMDIPKEPVIFFKSPSSLSGANDPILLPPGAEMLDWEVELAFVIGARAKRVSREGALGHVAGFMVLNDVSERHYQMMRGGQWAKGKSYDSFTPIGPYLVTDVADPHALNLMLSVNGQQMQNGSTADFIFDLPTVIEHISTFMTLEPGDIITTGTPAGVGFGMDPKRFLQPGDKVRTEITGLGVQEQVVVEDR